MTFLFTKIKASTNNSRTLNSDLQNTALSEIISNNPIMQNIIFNIQEFERSNSNDLTNFFKLLSKDINSLNSLKLDSTDHHYSDNNVPNQEHKKNYPTYPFRKMILSYLSNKLSNNNTLSESESNYLLILLKEIFLLKKDSDILFYKNLNIMKYIILIDDSFVDINFVKLIILDLFQKYLFKSTEEFLKNFSNLDFVPTIYDLYYLGNIFNNNKTTNILNYKIERIRKIKNFSQNQDFKESTLERVIASSKKIDNQLLVNENHIQFLLNYQTNQDLPDFKKLQDEQKKITENRNLLKSIKLEDPEFKEKTKQALEKIAKYNESNNKPKEERKLNPSVTNPPISNSTSTNPPKSTPTVTNPPKSTSTNPPKSTPTVDSSTNDTSTSPTKKKQEKKSKFSLGNILLFALGFIGLSFLGYIIYTKSKK